MIRSFNFARGGSLNVVWWSMKGTPVINRAPFPSFCCQLDTVDVLGLLASLLCYPCPRTGERRERVVKSERDERKRREKETKGRDERKREERKTTFRRTLILQYLSTVHVLHHYTYFHLTR